MITSTNFFTSLGVSAPTLSPATRQADDFLALLQSELGKSGGSDGDVPESNSIKPTAYGAPSGSYIKPMYLGVPVDLLDPPADEASKPNPDGVPTDMNTKPIASSETEPPVDVATTPTPDGVPVQVDAPVVAEGAGMIDLGAPTEATTQTLKA
jgi:hypothetical protein